MIPGATASVKLVPCESYVNNLFFIFIYSISVLHSNYLCSLSNANHSRMLEDRVKTTTIAAAGGQQKKQVRNGLVRFIVFQILLLWLLLTIVVLLAF